MVEKRGNGIKRNEAMFPLSHFHQNGLAIEMFLKRAETEESTYTVEELKEKLQQVLERGGNEHIRDEEEILLATYAQYTSLEAPEIPEMLVEHVQIRALVQQVISDGRIEDMHRLGNLLEQHIRKEERVIFPMIEEAVPVEVLKTLHPKFHQVEPPAEGIFFNRL